MPSFGDIAKGGWHPTSKDGKKKESWRGDFKGIDQIAGWMGKDKATTSAADESSSSTYTPMPISSLRDPASFAPPPKRSNTGPISPSPRPQTAVASQQPSYGRPSPQPDVEEERPPPQPYRRDTTGLSTSHLPPPPSRRDGADGRPPAPAPPAAARPPAPGTKPKPSLPPRLPPRQNEHPNEYTPAPPPPYSPTPDPVHQGILNQGAINRLGAAGVNVPGFGIGKAKPPSPPLPSRPGTARPASPVKAAAPPPPMPSPQKSQLSELQGRFARMTTSSTTKTEETQSPGGGTTWAQKQAALKTASNFRNNPSSVSFSDAKSAASTANNFRERHGEQVAAGYSTASNLNTKYGLSEKAGRLAGKFGVDGQQSQDSGIVMQDNTSNVVNAAAGKKPPPPPPKKRPDLGAGSAQTGSFGSTGGPPPIPLASKPKPQVLSQAAPQPTTSPTDMDLQLSTQWFSTSPPKWPPPFLAKYPGTKATTYTSGWSSRNGRKTHSLTMLIMHPSLAYSKIHLTWDAASPSHTVSAQQKHYPQPRTLGREELEAYKAQYNEPVAQWCEQQIGTQVGNGECWTLANEALKAVASTSSSRNIEPCMTSQSYIHGYLIYERIAPRGSQAGRSAFETPGGLAASGVARGDILQFWQARLESGCGWKSAGAPDHTSVVVGVGRDGELTVLEQNVGGKKVVMQGEYRLGDLTEGEVRVFRPVGESWLGVPELSWP